jgi:hypothetical protein
MFHSSSPVSSQNTRYQLSYLLLIMRFRYLCIFFRPGLVRKGTTLWHKFLFVGMGCLTSLLRGRTLKLCANSSRMHLLGGKKVSKEGGFSATMPHLPARQTPTPTMMLNKSRK